MLSKLKTFTASVCVHAIFLCTWINQPTQTSCEHKGRNHYTLFWGLKWHFFYSWIKPKFVLTYGVQFPVQSIHFSWGLVLIVLTQKWNIPHLQCWTPQVSNIALIIDVPQQCSVYLWRTSVAATILLWESDQTGAVTWSQTRMQQQAVR